MSAQDCATIIAAIATAQVTMIGALGALYLKVRENGRKLEKIAASSSELGGG